MPFLLLDVNILLYFGFQTGLLHTIELELHSNPVMLVEEVFIISSIQGVIIPKETRA